MDFDKMSPSEIAQYYTTQVVNNLISAWGTKSKEVKKINDKTHFEILKIANFIEANFPQSIEIIDELGKIGIPDAQMSYIKYSIAYGVNVEDAFSRLRKLSFECKKNYKVLSILTDEGKRNSSLMDLVNNIASRTHKYFCYNIPNINQKSIKFYDKEFLQKQLAILDMKNGGPIRFDQQSIVPIRGPMWYNGKLCLRYAHATNNDDICKKCKHRSCEVVKGTLA